jgi:hypothetical protein
VLVQTPGGGPGESLVLCVPAQIQNKGNLELHWPLKSPLDPKETKEIPLYTKSNISLCILKKNCCLNGTKLRFN